MLRVDKKTGVRVYDDFSSGVARNVTCILYIDDWGISYGKLLDFMAELGMECAVSPVHDRDTWSESDVNRWINAHLEDGKLTDDAVASGVPAVDQVKKSHVHVFLKSPAAHNSIWYYNLLLPLHEVTYFRVINSPSAMIRYFAHMDNPEKVQYSSLDVVGFGGFDLSPLLKCDAADKIRTFVNVMDEIDARHIHHYFQLVKYAISTGDLDFIGCVSGRASTFANYFKSESEYFKIKRKWRKLMETHPDLTIDELDKVFDY